MMMTQKELNKRLQEINEERVTKGNHLFTQGTNAVGKDLLPLLQSNEEVIDFCDARVSSLLKLFKGSNYIRCYLVITTKRIIYIERGNMIMGLNPLTKKTILIERLHAEGTVTANDGVEKIIYPYLLQINSGGEQYEISVKDDISPYLWAENMTAVQETGQERGDSIYGDLKKNVNDVPDHSAANSRTPKKKSRLPFIMGIAGGIVVIILLLLILLSTDENVVSSPGETVELNSYEGGFEGWEKSGFETSVETDITIPYPLTNTDINNYAVFIGIGKTNAGIIMQSDEAAVSEWDWLMSAQPDMTTQAYYFHCTLTYAGQNAGESGIPVFVIENAEPVGYEVGEQTAADTVDVSEYVGGNISDLLQAVPYLLTEDGEYYTDAAEHVMVNATDGRIDILMITGMTESPVCFKGISIGDRAESMSDAGLIDAGYTYYLEDETGIAYLYSDHMAGVIFSVDENGLIGSICWMSDCGELLETEPQSDTYDISANQTDNYSDGEYLEPIQWFAGDYTNENGIVTLTQDSAGFYAEGGLEIAGEFKAYVGDESIEALLIDQGNNEYALYQEYGNAVIGYLYLTEDSIMVSDVGSVDGIYELEYLYERDEP